ncbi:hypothetical protein SCP_0805400 [Sparassis crispa]|uniref:Uncharacterized protein n=1 Tax=Sparassis crispa TaxID=139825 RepID=A0A401GUZ0_9APHY|nr:hypothetical protein SCP_0805400 [Sparassis crispa]GBE86016.1 hypothetical protein SCP_0805400 [Sparassis crispa]
MTGLSQGHGQYSVRTKILSDPASHFLHQYISQNTPLSWYPRLYVNPSAPALRSLQGVLPSLIRPAAEP